MNAFATRFIETLRGWFRGDRPGFSGEPLRLENGETFRIRPATGEDVPAILAMHERLSPGSIFYRYLAFYRPGRADISAICHSSREAGAALVAEAEGTQGRIIGLAYFRTDRDRLGPPAAEPAVLIEDAYQNKGLGRHLFNRLIGIAESRRIAVMDATLHPDNERMKWIIRTAGWPAAEAREEDSLSIRLLLRPEYEAAFFQDYCLGPGRSCGWEFGWGPG
jgi:GNAT superfamily N-acetyltransferase